MARTPRDSVAKLLDQTSLSKPVKAAAWDAFHQAPHPDALTTHLNKLPLPQHVRANLWDLKLKHTASKEAKMLPRESKYGRGDKALSHELEPPRLKDHGAETAPGSVSVFIAEHFRHFNSATLHDAAEAYKAHLAKGGQMMVSLAGAMSTAELGRTLAPMIRQHKVHAISCTGANLEEDLFNLVAHDEYERFPDYTELTPPEDAALAKRNINRVTDTGIPEKAAMTPIEQAFTDRLKKAKAEGARVFPHEILYDIVNTKELAAQYQGAPEHSWLVAAAEANIPIVVPGWADSTLGNVFAAECLHGKYDPTLVKGSIEYMVELTQWYQATSKTHELGFFQIGGGIAGDYAICCVPLLEQDAGMTGTKKWTYFCQITDSHDSNGGYSGARPTEKASWGKIEANTPTFDIHSDASICAPLIFAYVLGM